MNYSVLRRKVAHFFVLIIFLIVIDRTLHVVLQPDGLSSEAAATAVLIPLIGEIYAVLLAFMIFVIWTQFTQVEDCVLREANSLNELVRYTSVLLENQCTAVKRCVSRYVNLVLDQEWSALANGQKDSQTQEAFVKLASSVISAAPGHDYLLETLRTVSRNRDERIAKSLIRIPPTLLGLVQIIAIVLWILIYLYSFGNRSYGIICYSTTAFVLFIANFVLTDTDNPLKGLWNVRPDAFSELPR